MTRVTGPDKCHCCKHKGFARRIKNGYIYLCPRCYQRIAKELKKGDSE